MADDKYESPAEAPHFTTDEVSDAGPEKESVAPDKTSAGSDPQQRAPDNTEIADEMTKTAVKGPHN